MKRLIGAAIVLSVLTAVLLGFLVNDVMVKANWDRPLSHEQLLSIYSSFTSREYNFPLTENYGPIYYQTAWQTVESPQGSVDVMYFIWEKDGHFFSSEAYPDPSGMRHEIYPLLVQELPNNQLVFVANNWFGTWIEVTVSITTGEILNTESRQVSDWLVGTALQMERERGIDDFPSYFQVASQLAAEREVLQEVTWLDMTSWRCLEGPLDTCRIAVQVTGYGIDNHDITVEDFQEAVVSFGIRQGGEWVVIQSSPLNYAYIFYDLTSWEIDGSYYMSVCTLDEINHVFKIDSENTVSLASTTDQGYCGSGGEAFD